MIHSIVVEDSTAHTTRFGSKSEESVQADWPEYGIAAMTKGLQETYGCERLGEEEAVLVDVRGCQAAAVILGN